MLGLKLVLRWVCIEKSRCGKGVEPELLHPGLPGVAVEDPDGLAPRGRRLRVGEHGVHTEPGGPRQRNVEGREGAPVTPARLRRRLLGDSPRVRWDEPLLFNLQC